jgi:hypothetical protein
MDWCVRDGCAGKYWWVVIVSIISRTVARREAGRLDCGMFNAAL